ncbi:class F sortase [Phycicoccus sp. HDW14]|uniref:class F sortase n=1 Tax=Phycicoccus sp. HDW14 TaxID=2714941 RepID=UPI00140758A8|nr:class F sortase [Phycicoccus sp. HDW14]QIM21783.1 class F sortase [Phycicoccus sp. HDW14]
MEPAAAARRWRVGAAVSLVVAVAAVVALTGWFLGRPAPTAGDGLGALRETTTTAAPTPTPTPSVRPSVSASVRAATPEAATAPPPARLRIPALGVDATVRAVGVQRDGAMVIPASPTSVGWYRYGSAPADPLGHTVIAGHVATREDGAGALAPLAGAEKGMRVEVVDADGTTHRYVVRGRESIRKKALPVDEIFAREGRPLLVLVTCGGEYIPELRSHRDNVVVTAVPVP